ncbi:hypothetical protein SASPL_111977 [Salvia splendens]|uniref:Uncharacterized protein n=1 Tax=Salvia splendens TaxID=180675 RepID=A0A8X8YCY9_SALSN|nr:hypothetical protein SASPL_111977 [Salvia splendens]
MGRLMLRPKMLALITVQRHTAASRSASPWIRVQHGVTGGVPMVTLRRFPSRLAHMPNFRASLGHDALPGCWLGGVAGGWFGGVPAQGLDGLHVLGCGGVLEPGFGIG